MCQLGKWIVCIVLGVCALWDLKKKEIPLLLLVLMGFIIVLQIILEKPINWWGIFSGALIGMLCLFFSKCTREAIGYGDSWLILELGLYLGGICLLQVLFLASVMAGLLSLFYLWKKQWKRKATIPFIPFIALACGGVLFL